jgi:hypothetical protein
MSEMWQIILTATLTVAGGIIIYFFSHLFVAFFVEPIHRLRSLIGEISLTMPPREATREDIIFASS